MLTLVINPGGTRRVVSIAQALYHFGHDVHRKGGWPERTPDERRRHRAEVRRAYREQQLRRERGEA